MPIFDYKCECGKEAEVIESFADKRVRRCECGGKMYRQITSSNFRINSANDLDSFGKPGYAEDRARQCGVEV